MLKDPMTPGQGRWSSHLPPFLLLLYVFRAIPVCLLALLRLPQQGSAWLRQELPRAWLPEGKLTRQGSLILPAARSGRSQQAKKTMYPEGGSDRIRKMPWKGAFSVPVQRAGRPGQVPPRSPVQPGRLFPEYRTENFFQQQRTLIPRIEIQILTFFMKPSFPSFRVATDTYIK